MTDNISPAQRSRNMRRIRGKDTVPEILVRRLVHGMGIRYRLHRKDLPGTPDLVFTSRRKVIFVHGCFWHQHNCSRGKRPSSNVKFWDAKLEGNLQRDKADVSSLKEKGWRVLIVWECEIKEPAKLSRRIESFLKDDRHSHEKNSSLTSMQSGNQQGASRKEAK